MLGTTAEGAAHNGSYLKDNIARFAQAGRLHSAVHKQRLTKWNTASPAAGSGTSSLAISHRRPNSTRAGMSLAD